MTQPVRRLNARHGALQTAPPKTWTSWHEYVPYFRNVAGRSQMQGMGREVCERAAICGPRICANAPRTTDRTGRYELTRSRAGRRKQLLPLYEKPSVVTSEWQ